jgi:hypothetical protein
MVYCTHGKVMVCKVVTLWFKPQEIMGDLQPGKVDIGTVVISHKFFRSAFSPTIAGTFEPATPKARHLPGLRGRLAPVPRLCAAGHSAEAWNYTSQFFSPLKSKTC